MLLTYSFRQFPELILQEIKIHTIRADETNRWRAGRTIQHWMHNPRNKSKNPYHFKDSECISTQKIEIGNVNHQYVMVDDKLLDAVDVIILAQNDGFDTVADFWDYFKLGLQNGKIIHWTDYKY